MPIARLCKRSVNDDGTSPPAPVRVSGFALGSILLLATSSTQRKLERSFPHPVSNIRQFGRLSLDANSSTDEDGSDTGQPVGPGMASSSPLGGESTQEGPEVLPRVKRSLRPG